jgi:hypothetical protein
MSHPNLSHPDKLANTDSSVAHILFWSLIGFSVLTGFFLLGIF